MNEMNMESLIQVLCAAHLTYAIDPVPKAFSQRGGIMLVAPPEQLKTVAVQGLKRYSNALVLGDITTQQMVKLRDEFAQGRYQSLVITEVEKIYKRDQETASNVEGHIQAMVEEGFGHAAFEDKNAFVRVAKAMMIGALAEAKCRRRYPEWKESGFARRFLWCHFMLKNPRALSDAIRDWMPIEFCAEEVPDIPADSIPWIQPTPAEADRLRILIENQDGQTTPYVLMQKILCVLKWRYRALGPKASKKAMEVIEDFGHSLNKPAGGALLVIKTKNGKA